MEKHAVPQNIMDVEFKLFGGLTVRQFGYIAVSFIVALILYFAGGGITRLVTIPIIVFVVITGLALAFLRVNDQPFSVWFGNFIKSLFGSQRRVYHKTNKQAAVLSKSVAGTAVKAVKDTDPLIKRKLDSRENLGQKLNANQSENEPSEVKDDGVEDILAPDKASVLDIYFNKVVGDNLGQYNLKPSGQTMASAQMVQGNTVPISGAVQSTMKVQSNVAVRPISNAAAVQETIMRTPGNAQPPSQSGTRPAQPAAMQTAGEATTGTAIELATKTRESGADTTEPAAQPVQAIATLVQNNEPRIKEAAEIKADEEEKGAPSLKILNQLRPNQIAGFICDANSEPVARALVLVKNEKGEPLRSVYSDINGKFIVPTVLADGNYVLEVQATNYRFPEFQVELKGELLPMYRYLATN